MLCGKNSDLFEVRVCPRVNLMLQPLQTLDRYGRSNQYCRKGASLNSFGTRSVPLKTDRRNISQDPIFCIHQSCCGYNSGRLPVTSENVTVAVSSFYGKFWIPTYPTSRVDHIIRIQLYHGENPLGARSPHQITYSYQGITVWHPGGTNPPVFRGGWWYTVPKYMFTKKK